MLGALLPSPVTTVRMLSAGQLGRSGTVADTAMLSIVTLAVWALLSWAGLITCAALSARVPGAFGTVAQTCLGRLAPTAVRQVLLSVVGASVVTGLAACSAPSGIGTTASEVEGVDPGPAQVVVFVHVGRDTTEHRIAVEGSAVRFEAPWSTATLPGPAPARSGPASTPTPTTTSVGRAGTAIADDRREATAPAPERLAATATVTAGSRAAPVSALARREARATSGRVDQTETVTAVGRVVSASAFAQRGPTAFGRLAGPAPRPAPEAAFVPAFGPASGPGTGPGTGPATGPVSVDWPVAGESPAPDTVGSVVVLRGDSLWAIAARHLPAGADDAHIDRAWRAWYRANAAVVGSDPNYILPGQILLPPTQETGT